MASFKIIVMFALVVTITLAAEIKVTEQPKNEDKDKAVIAAPPEMKKHEENKEAKSEEKHQQQQQMMKKEGEQKQDEKKKEELKKKEGEKVSNNNNQKVKKEDDDDDVSIFQKQLLECEKNSTFGLIPRLRNSISGRHNKSIGPQCRREKTL